MPAPPLPDGGTEATRSPDAPPSPRPPATPRSTAAGGPSARVPPPVDAPPAAFESAGAWSVLNPAGDRGGPGSARSRAIGAGSRDGSTAGAGGAGSGGAGGASTTDAGGAVGTGAGVTAGGTGAARGAVATCPRPFGRRDADGGGDGADGSSRAVVPTEAEAGTRLSRRSTISAGSGSSRDTTSNASAMTTAWSASDS